MMAKNRCLPAEWAPQYGVQLTWPHPNTDWNNEPGMLQEVTECYLQLANEIAKREKLIIVTPTPEIVITLLEQHLPIESLINVSLIECDTDDTWARDHGFFTVFEENKHIYIDFKFNGWGGKFPASRDNAISRHLYDSELLPQGDYEDALDFELEGGSIESDGQGTILTTARCNLNPNRRAVVPEAECQQYVEDEFRRRLGAQRILWLHHGGLEHDDTDAHIDTLARLCPDDTIIFGDGCPEMEEELRHFLTPQGKPYRLIKVPPYYANFLILNGAVLLPYYESAEQNELARQALQQAFPDREIIGIDCRVLLRQNGSLHCCTMQYPL